MSKKLDRFSKLFDLNGWVAVVTGAAQGNGFAISKALDEAGANVIQTDISFDKRSESVGKQMILDVTEEEQVKRIFEKIKNEFGSLDILINNAGIINKNTVDKLKIDEFKKVIDVNVIGTVLCTKHIVPYMKEQKRGRIVNISSSQAFLRTPEYSAYSASKAAVSHLTRIWGNELAEFGIHVNAICPSFVMTPMMEESIRKKSKQLGTDEQGAIEYYISDIPLKRILNMEEIANWVLVLCSELVRSTTGNNYSITAGQVQL